MRKAPGASPEAHDQSCLRWFTDNFAGWLKRSPALRQQLITNLGTRNFREAYTAWIEGKVEELPPDLRQQRADFISALSAVGRVPISDSAFYDIVHDVECFRIEPERRQAREEIRRGKQLTEQMRGAVQHLLELLQVVDRPNPTARGESGTQRFVVMSDLQSLLGETVPGRALRERMQRRLRSMPLSPGEPSELLSGALGDLAQRLEHHLQGWDKRYGLENKNNPDLPLGNTPNLAAHDLVHRLSEIYAAAGGKLAASWDYHKACPGGPFSRFLTLIYAALPHSVRYHAADNPSGFATMAGEVLADRKQGIRTSGTMLMWPTTDEAHRAALAHRNSLQERTTGPQGDRES